MTFADEEFHDGCQAFCACTQTGMQCAPLECPTDFGLDLLDPECLDWETVPKNFVPQAPHCCPDKVSCRNNGSCVYLEQRFPNFSEIPSKVPYDVRYSILGTRHSHHAGRNPFPSSSQEN